MCIAQKNFIQEKLLEIKRSIRRAWRGIYLQPVTQGVISVFNVGNKLKKKFLFKQERDSYSSFNRASFVTFVTAKAAKVTI